MFALYKNVLEDSDVLLSSSAESSVQPLANLADDRLIKYARIGGGEQYIQAVCGTPKTIDSMAIAGWGFSSVVFQASNIADFSTLLINETVANLYTQPDTQCGFLYVWLPAKITAKYFRIVFSGDGKKSIGKVMIGTMTRFPWMESKQKLSKVSTVKRARSAGGQLYAGNSGYIARTNEISFPDFNDAGYALFDDLWQTVHNTRPFFSIVWDDKQNVWPILYGALDQDGIDFEATGNPTLPFSTKLKIAECF